MLVPEWTKQAGVLLAWPHQGTDWRAILDTIESTYAQLASYISHHETVYVLCVSVEMIPGIKKRLEQHKADMDNIAFFIVPYNDTWIRDYGPLTTCQHGQYQFEKFQFNGWGNKFQANLDNEAFTSLSKMSPFSSTPTRQHQLILEGGSIDSNGKGSILTTKDCLLNPNRNPDLSKEQIESQLLSIFSATEIIWLEEHLPGDDTDGHIDTLARFCDPQTIVYVDTPKLQQQASELNFEAIPLPQVPLQLSADNEPLPATYANFLIINDAVIMPTYQCPEDDEAIAIIKQIMPMHQVLPLDSRPIIQQNGSIHCITMQIPREALAHGADDTGSLDSTELFRR